MAYEINFDKTAIIGVMCSLSILPLWGCSSKDSTTGPPGFEIPPPIGLEIIHPASDVERLVGDGVIWTVEGKVRKLVTSRPWPPSPDDITKVECFIDGKLVDQLGPEDISLAHFENVSPSPDEDPLGYWYFACNITDFGTPGRRGKHLLMRVWRKNKYAEATTTFDYDNEALRREARNYMIFPFMNEEGKRERMARSTIYYLNQEPKIQELIDYTLQEFIGPRAKLKFIPTQDESKRPLLIYLKDDGCGVVDVLEWDPVLLIIWGLVLAADSNKLISLAQNWWTEGIICHETGHALGLPHDNFDSCMDDTYGGALRLHPIQQKGLQLLYSKLPGYDWRKEQ